MEINLEIGHTHLCKQKVKAANFVLGRTAVESKDRTFIMCGVVHS